MQLFSIGILQLNMDGSNKLDEDGNTILAYTNDDIVSFSRAWTGFDLQDERGNMETKANLIDPMKIVPKWRDRFPKTETTGGYIGDTYPLCSDLPLRSFLRKGAKYKFLGSSPLPELVNDPSQFADDTLGDIVRAVLDQGSSLRSLLCNEDQDGNCVFQNSVTLEDNYGCFGIECEIELPRVVQVTDNAFYEYVHPPCVNMVFYNDPVKVSPRRNIDAVLCADPKVALASVACCNTGEVLASSISRFSGERTTFSMAESRCASVSQEVCDFYSVSGSFHLTKGYYWTTGSCSLLVKIKQNGNVAVVHEPNAFAERVMYVNSENPYYFGVYWERGGDYPLVSNNCDNVCDVMSDGSCLCNTRVIESIVFDKMPTSVAVASAELSIGAVDPSSFDEDTYSIVTNTDSTIKAYLKNNEFDLETVFEYTNDKGRKLFMKNSRSSVYLLGTTSGFSGQSFRNAPQFMSFVPTETNLR